MMPAGRDGPASMMPADVPATLPITLGQFVKLAGLAGTGGEAKMLILSGMVHVNGRTETRRGRKLAAGDLVEVGAAAARLIVMER
jgi:ribosome-associated protein